MSELEYACMKLSIAIRNPRAIERKEFREKNALIVATQMWHEMGKTSSRSRRLQNLARK